MKTSIPFTYLIGWTRLGVFYYGVRYAEGCSPDELWTTYFTSSKYVTDYRLQHGEPDAILTRKTFSCSQKAREWENKVLRRLKIKLRTDFLNRTDNIGPPSTRGLKFSEDRRKRHSIRVSGEGNGMFGKKHSEDSKRKMSSTKTWKLGRLKR